MRTRNKSNHTKTKELDPSERELFLNAFYQRDFSTVEKYVQTRSPEVKKAVEKSLQTDDPDEEDAKLFLEAIACIAPSISLAKDVPAKEKTSSRLSTPKKKTPIDAKLDLHGLHAEQAVAYLLRFLEQERIRNSKTLLVVHGKGQGILKQAVWSIIETHPFVDDFSVAPGKFGGHGAIIVRINRRFRRT